jgi:hypothetical protein
VFGFSPSPSGDMHICTAWQILPGLSKNHLKIFAHSKSPDTAAMGKHQRDESLGTCLSTDMNSATPSFTKHVAIQTPIMVKHHGGELGKCVTKDASASSNNFVSSTSYQYLPGNKITLKTTMLGLALPPKPISRPNPPPTSKLGTVEVTRPDSDPSDKGRKQKRPCVSPSNDQ